MAQNINPFLAQQANTVKQNEEVTNRSKDNHAVSKRYVCVTDNGSLYA